MNLTNNNTKNLENILLEERVKLGGLMLSVSNNIIMDFSENSIRDVFKISDDIISNILKEKCDFIIVSPRVATILQASRKQFSSVSIDNKVISTIIEVGKINDSISVYRDNLAPIDFVIICSKDDTISDTGSILDSGKCVRIIDIRNLNKII